MLITKTVPVNQIVLGSQMRESDVSPTNHTQIQLVASIIELGLMNPIEVHIGPQGEYKLWDGGRRLAAVKQLGINEISITYSEQEGDKS